MNTVMHIIANNTEAFRWLLVLVVLLAFYRWMQSDNGLEWQDFISSKASDGKWHGDINKLGQVTGIVIGSIALIQVAPGAGKDFTGFALVLTAYFTFVGGVAGYAAYLRSKTSTTQTTVTTEPAADPPPAQKTTMTVTEPAK